MFLFHFLVDCARLLWLETLQIRSQLSTGSNMNGIFSVHRRPPSFSSKVSSLSQRTGPQPPTINFNSVISRRTRKPVVPSHSTSAQSSSVAVTPRIYQATSPFDPEQAAWTRLHTGAARGRRPSSRRRRPRGRPPPGAPPPPPGRDPPGLLAQARRRRRRRPIPSTATGPSGDARRRGAGPPAATAPGEPGAR